MTKKEAETMESLLGSCEAARSYIQDESKSPRRREANLEGLEASIAQAKSALFSAGRLSLGAIDSELPSAYFRVIQGAQA